MFGMKWRDLIKDHAVGDELENLTVRLKRFLLVSLNEDGTLRAPLVVRNEGDTNTTTITIINGQVTVDNPGNDGSSGGDGTDGTGIDSPPGSPGPVSALNVLRRTTVLTNEQILALGTTEVTLVPAPGPGLFLKPRDVFVITDTRGAVYTNVHTFAGYLNIHTADWTQDLFSYLGNGTVDGSADETGLRDLSRNFGETGRWYWHPQRYATIGEDHADLDHAALNVNFGLQTYASPNNDGKTLIDVSVMDNKALMISGFNKDTLGSTEDFTGGHANNRMYVTVEYTIERIPP